MVCGALSFKVPLTIFDSTRRGPSNHSATLGIRCSNSKPAPLATVPGEFYTAKGTKLVQEGTYLKWQKYPEALDITIVLERVEILEDHASASITGGALGFESATTSLTQKLLTSSKKVTIVRHGLSSWNSEGRVQGSSNLSVLTEAGVIQAEKCRKALETMHFDKCFSSPISRAKTTAEVMWKEREEPLVFLDSLKEAHLFFLEGMRNVFGGSGC